MRVKDGEYTAEKNNRAEENTVDTAATDTSRQPDEIK